MGFRIRPLPRTTRGLISLLIERGDEIFTGLTYDYIIHLETSFHSQA